MKPRSTTLLLGHSEHDSKYLLACSFGCPAFHVHELNFCFCAPISHLDVVTDAS